MAPASCAATLNERLEPLPGDALVPDAALCATHAICIDAAADDVWPWLAQVGAGRAGWYSHDWIDNPGARSAERLLPGVKPLAPGDVLPVAPGGAEGFVVVSVDAPRALVLAWRGAGGDAAVASWAFLLRGAVEGNRTRLLVRARVSRAALRPAAAAGRPRDLAERVLRALPHLPAPLLRAMASLGHDFMERKQLRGIKWRAELPALD